MRRALTGRTRAQRHNAELSAQSLDGAVYAARRDLLVLSHRVKSWSFDQGIRQSARFPTMANSIPAFGGGVCQTSTTLYNAALLAGLPIIERHHHVLRATLCSARPRCRRRLPVDRPAIPQPLCRTHSRFVRSRRRAVASKFPFGGQRRDAPARFRLPRSVLADHLSDTYRSGAPRSRTMTRITVTRARSGTA